MKRKYTFAILAALAITTYSCRYNPLDSYQRIPPEREQEEQEETGGLNGKFASGFGTKDEPYILKTAAHMRNISSVMEEGELVCFRMEADIDLSGENWVPINIVDPLGRYIDFDGNGHIIKGLTIKDQRYSSFFGILCGECYNVGFVDARVEGSNSASGVIAGYLGMRTPANANIIGHVEGCYASGTVIGSPAGGLVGYAGTSYNGNDNYVRNSYSAVNVSTSGHGGGIVGVALTGSKIDHCYAAGKVTCSNDSNNASGIAGNCEGSSALSDCISWNSAIYATHIYPVASLQGESTATDCLVWNGIEGVGEIEGTMSKTQLQEKAALWGSPWYADATVAKGFPALEWQVNRGDVESVCGLVAIVDPEPEPEPEPDPEPGQPVTITEGSGTQSDPYQISKAGHMLYIPQVLKHGETVYFKLTQDINMRDAGVFPPLNATAPYDCLINFDGDNHKLVGFISRDGEMAGLFGVLSGNCRNLSFENPDVSTETGLCGILGARIENAILENVNVTGGRVTSTVNSDEPVGVFAAYMSGSTEFRNCCAEGVSVTNNNTGTASATGGFVGCVTGTGNKFNDCRFDGSVISQKGNTDVGGFVGKSGADLEFTACSVGGTIQSKGERTGGFVGGLTAGATLQNCEFTGSITSGSNRVGGFVGHIKSSAALKFDNCKAGSAADVCSITAEAKGYIGGLVGHTEAPLYINGCEFNGNFKVDGSSYVGGLVGVTTGNITEITNSSTTGQLGSVQKMSGGLVGVTDPMKIIIQGCTSSMTITDALTEAYSGLGGLVGNWRGHDESKIVGCRFAGSIESRKNSIGGIVGNHEKNRLVIESTVNSGKVTGESYCGGFVGMQSDPASKLEISNSISSGDVICTGQTVGGFVGEAKKNVVVRNCLTTGSLQSKFTVGGICGRANNASWSVSDANLNIVVEQCLVWSPTIKVLLRDGSDGGGSGIVCGFTSPYNTLKS
ncbi:MAG: hypothetical protein SPE21_04135, partial [Candidatus Cryptobacteroides sp.]|nr:hypothetical protein [Candidatus Cryptobacteroides sp.]